MFGVARLLPAVRSIASPARKHVIQIRNGSDWKYREINLNVSNKVKYKAEIMTAFMWYWILFHMWYQWEHFVGTGQPDPRKWTNAELGIPPDDSD